MQSWQGRCLENNISSHACALACPLAVGATGHLVVLGRVEVLGAWRVRWSTHEARVRRERDTAGSAQPKAGILNRHEVAAAAREARERHTPCGRPPRSWRVRSSNPMMALPARATGSLLKDSLPRPMKATRMPYMKGRTSSFSSCVRAKPKKVLPAGPMVRSAPRPGTQGEQGSAVRDLTQLRARDQRACGIARRRRTRRVEDRRCA